MKKALLIAAAAAMVTTIACSDIKKEPNRIYMPDMGPSRAYETYIERDTAAFTMNRNDWHAADGKAKIFYNNQPVPGTVARGESYVFHLKKDEGADTANYVASSRVPNPFPMPDSTQMKEVERIYLINCAICHGPKLDGNGPLYADGNGPYPARPANLSGTDPKYVSMSDGTMFFSITYGRNLMGSYASQVTPKQRWDIVHYIRQFQSKTLGTGTKPNPVGGAGAQSSPNANNVQMPTGDSTGGSTQGTNRNQ